MCLLMKFVCLPTPHSPPDSLCHLLWETNRHASKPSHAAHLWELYNTILNMHVCHMPGICQCLMILIYICILFVWINACVCLCMDTYVSVYIHIYVYLHISGAPRCHMWCSQSQQQWQWHTVPDWSPKDWDCTGWSNETTNRCHRQQHWYELHSVRYTVECCMGMPMYVLHNNVYMDSWSYRIDCRN